MSNRIMLTTDNIKTMIKQYSDNEELVILSRYKPKDSNDTLVLVSQLKISYEPYGFLIYWANENSITQGNTQDKAQQIAKEMQSNPLPF